MEIRFLNASVLPRKALNRNLSWNFPLGNLLPKTRVLERKRQPNANASLGTEKVPQRTFATKILPNIRVNFLVRFASNPLFL